MNADITQLDLSVFSLQDHTKTYYFWKKNQEQYIESFTNKQKLAQSLLQQRWIASIVINTLDDPIKSLITLFTRHKLFQSWSH
jgi:hypothetical protein